METFKKVSCPHCGRTILHYIDGTGENATYRALCERCKRTVLIFSAGKTSKAETISIELKINF